MTLLAPSVITETVDTESGDRITDAVLTVNHIVGLTCGCVRYECDRPGGGVVHVVRGAHCERLAERPSRALAGAAA